MKLGRFHSKKLSWFALLGFALVQMGALTHLSLVGHDLDRSGHTVHTDKHQHPRDPAPEPVNSGDEHRSNCQVLHFLDHSAGLVVSAAPLWTLSWQALPSTQQWRRRVVRPAVRLYRLSPAQSPPRVQIPDLC